MLQGKCGDGGNMRCCGRSAKKVGKSVRLDVDTEEAGVSTVDTSDLWGTSHLGRCVSRRIVEDRGRPVRTKGLDVVEPRVGIELGRNSHGAFCGVVPKNRRRVCVVVVSNWLAVNLDIEQLIRYSSDVVYEDAVGNGGRLSYW